MDKALKEILKNVKDSASVDNSTSPYDTTATVVRLDGATVWVHIPGGVAETPAAKSISCAVGDTVRVRVSGGKAWLTGNDSAPPTDDTAAKDAKKTAAAAGVAAYVAKEHATVAQSTADDAKTTAEAAQEKAKATAAHFWSDAEGAHVTYTEEGDTISGGNVLIDTDSIKVRNGYTVLAEFGADGAIIGQNNDQKITITNDTFTAVNADGSKAAVIKSNYGPSERKVTEALSWMGRELSYTPVTGTVITAETWTSSSKVEFTAGTSATKTINGKELWADETYTFTYDGNKTITSTASFVSVTYYTTETDGDVLKLADGNVTFGWDGTASAMKLIIHGDITTDSGGLINRMQAGNVLMTPAGAETVTYNGIKYYKAIAKITFRTEFDEAPEVVIAPTTAVPYRMFVAPANITATGFTINFFRDSQTKTGIHWIAMPRTQ